MTTADVPYIQAPVPAPLAAAPEQVLALVEPVLDRLADVVAGSLAYPPDTGTPCTGFDLATLRDHALGWAQFFAAAMTDPQRHTDRPDPLQYRAADDPRELGSVVLGCRADLSAAVRAGVLDGDVVLSQSRMNGPAALGVILVEYLLHGWDLARATGQTWDPPAAGCKTCLDFLRALVTPQYRGGVNSTFAQEVPVPSDADALDRLLGFAGRDPGWRPRH